jgi:dedicator of cytokinesis protein 3
MKSHQVRVIDHCLKLHGQLCPPEFVPFHETLEKFFRKNFREEIRRLGLDDSSETITISPSVRSQAAGPSAAPSQYQSSIYAASVAGTTSGSSVRRAPFTLPPLQFGRTMSPPPLSPQSQEENQAVPGRVQQTPLQRHLAHLARHGINGVSSAPGESFGSDSVSAGSPHDSFVNVGNGIHAGGSNGVQGSNASVVTSNPGGSGSLVSLGGSIRGRISRFGSLNFGRRG